MLGAAEGVVGEIEGAVVGENEGAIVGENEGAAEGNPRSIVPVVVEPVTFCPVMTN